MWQKQISPSEFNQMAYWEFEQYIIFLSERNKEENDSHEDQKQQQEDTQKSMMPKMPNFSNFNP